MEELAIKFVEFNYEQFLLLAADKRTKLSDTWNTLFSGTVDEGLVDKSLSSLSLALSDTQNLESLIAIARERELATLNVLLPYRLDCTQMSKLATQVTAIEQLKINLQDILVISI